MQRKRRFPWLPKDPLLTFLLIHALVSELILLAVGIVEGVKFILYEIKR
jgi:hypothetical protein